MTENVSSMNEITNWNYDISVKKMKVWIPKWKNIGIDVLKELHTAREELSKTGRPKSDANESLSWAQYCEDIGVTKSTANRWLSRLDIETGEIKQIEAPKKETQKEAPKNEIMNLDSIIDKTIDFLERVNENLSKSFINTDSDEWENSLMEHERYEELCDVIMSLGDLTMVNLQYENEGI